MNHPRHFNPSMIPFRNGPMGEKALLLTMWSFIHPFFGWGSLYMLVFWMSASEFVPAIGPGGELRATTFKALIIMGIPRWIVAFGRFFYFPQFVIEAVRLFVVAVIVAFAVKAQFTYHPELI